MEGSSRIQLISKQDPCVQKAAEFAVDDYNRKNKFTSVKLVEVETAARELVFGVIYYLTIKVNPIHILMKNDILYMETAVWDIPHLKFMRSVELASHSNDSHMLEKGLSDPKIEAVINVGLNIHNGREHLKLRLVTVIDCTRFSSKNYVKHHCTFIAQDPAKSVSLLCHMDVVEHSDDGFMESNRLAYLCDYPFLKWISIELLKQVRMMFAHKHRIVICQNDDSIMVPLFKNGDSVCQLLAIAADLGVERTRNELIPFLSTKNEHVDAATLLVMAEKLKAFIPHVGGIEYAYVLLPPLGTLCSTEDPFVRNKVVESLCFIGGQMKEIDFLHHFIPFIEKLAISRCFADRVSSCGLFHITYPSAPKSMKVRLRLLYGQLSHDDMTAVRRSAAFNLGNFATVVEPSHLKADMIPILINLTEDVKDSIRLKSAESCTTLMKVLEPQDIATYISPVIIKLSQDKFWHVRYVVAKDFYFHCLTWMTDHTREEVLLAYAHLLQDIDALVRVAATENVAKLCRTLNSITEIDSILSFVKELPSDSHRDVRSTLASVIMGMAPVLGKDASVAKLVPIIVDLLYDEYNNVQLNIIKKLDEADQIFMGIESLSQPMLDATIKLAWDEELMVRLEIMEQIPVLARQLGANELWKICTRKSREEEERPLIRNAANRSLEHLATYTDDLDMRMLSF